VSETAAGLLARGHRFQSAGQMDGQMDAQEGDAGSDCGGSEGDGGGEEVGGEEKSCQVLSPDFLSWPKDDPIAVKLELDDDQVMKASGQLQMNPKQEKGLLVQQGQQTSATLLLSDAFSGGVKKEEEVEEAEVDGEEAWWGGHRSSSGVVEGSAGAAGRAWLTALRQVSGPDARTQVQKQLLEFVGVGQKVCPSKLNFPVLFLSKNKLKESCCDAFFFLLFLKKELKKELFFFVL